MENILTIDQYIAANMGSQIQKRAKSPLMGLVVLAAGVGLLVLMNTSHLADSLQALLLTLGILATGVGVVVTAMCLTKTMWHWHYLPSNRRMRLKRLYLDVSDYRRCIDALGANRPADLVRLRPIGTSNEQLRILYSSDHSIALLQAGGLETGHFEPATPVIQINGTEFAAIKELCR